MEKIIDSIKNDHQGQNEADEHFTKALEALEELNWDEAQNMAQAVLDTSCNIEQRLAATFLFYLAVERNPLVASAYIAIAYQYE